MTGEPAIYFIADLCRVLRTSRRSIQRLRRFGAFPIPELPDIAYAESLVGAVYFDQRNDVSQFLEALDRMCAQAAPAHTTRAILGGFRKEI